jgi:hypothetical protein
MVMMALNLRRKGYRREGYRRDIVHVAGIAKCSYNGPAGTRTAAIQLF